MSMNYRRPISWTYWEQRWAQREAELAHLQKRGVRLLVVGSLILLAVGLTLIANKWPLAHRCLRVADAIDLTDPCGPKAPKVHGRTSTTPVKTGHDPACPLGMSDFVCGRDRPRRFSFVGKTLDLGRIRDVAATLSHSCTSIVT
jgi:hypothetical protein